MVEKATYDETCTILILKAPKGGILHIVGTSSVLTLYYTTNSQPPVLSLCSIPPPLNHPKIIGFVYIKDMDMTCQKRQLMTRPV